MNWDDVDGQGGTLSWSASRVGSALAAEAVEGVCVQDALHAVGVDVLDAMDGGVDEGLEGDLVDGSGDTLGGVEQGGDGGVGEDVVPCAGVLEVEADVVAGVLDAEGSEGGDVGEAVREGLQQGLSEGVQQRLGAGEEDTEASSSASSSAAVRRRSRSRVGAVMPSASSKTRIGCVPCWSVQLPRQRCASSNMSVRWRRALSPSWRHSERMKPEGVVGIWPMRKTA